MNFNNQRLMLHLTLPFLLFFGGALFVVTGWLPPPSPSLTAAEVTDVFSQRGMFRIALAFAAFFSPFFISITVSIAIQMRRMEEGLPILTWTQLSMGLLGCVALNLPPFFWLALSFRPDIPGSLMVTLNDFAWFQMIGATGPLFIQLMAIAVCIFTGGKTDHIYPRWVAFLSIFIMLGVWPGVLIPFFKTGPFAWNGIISFWVIAISFFVWVGVMYVMTLRAIRNHEIELGSK